MDRNNDTIVAISTPPGEGGIGIVRLSGKESLRIVERIFSSSEGEGLSSRSSHSTHHGYIKVHGKGEIVHQVLVTVMRSPRTYTKEDIVEINCHGGNMPLKKVLELCLNEGARLAEPGEFTKRAFLNGRIDLSQAEAVLDIIKSKTDAARRIAAEQLEGTLSGEVRGLRNSIIDTLSEIELAIDFTGEDVKFATVGNITKNVDNLHSSIEGILKTADKGMILREGIKAVICGRPNVGKSSLMNAFLRHDRVIVTPIAGTTRDIIEESINISGVTVRLSDTAGIIESKDRVEIEGIKRSRKKLEEADIVIFMIDSSQALSGKDEEIYNAIKEKNVIIAANKIDLPRKFDIIKAREKFNAEEVLEVSALEKIGLEKIEEAIAEKVFDSGGGIPEGIVVTNLRHKQALENALGAIKRGMKVAGKDYNGELLASDLNEAVFQLGLIIGESVEKDVLDRIFSQFCIGK
jgi:tRNA modification GTPase